jgi:hypothetical protein
MRGPNQRLQIFGGLEELLSSGMLIQGELDTLAQAFHRNYRESRQSDGREPATDKPWSMLAETFKMSNRRRADHMSIAFAQAGLRLVPASMPMLLELDTTEVELLSCLEHRRWVIERRLLGVSYGETRRQYPSQHDRLVDWERLPESERERNRLDIRKIPQILAEAKFEIQRERKILAIGSALGTAVSQLQTALAGKDRGYVVIADVDEADGCRAAELALEMPDSTLWLVSRDYPLQLGRLPQEIWEGAAGWIARDQFHRVAS